MYITRIAHFLAALALAALATGCATAGRGATTANDPWEGFNRGVFGFNEGLDKAVLKPVAQGYNVVMPDFAREGVNNFFANLDDVPTGLNNMLQGKVGDGFADLGRFAINSVFGIFGLWDVASPLGLEKHEEDFGQTLAVWGVNSGPYLVLPLFGPSNLRDGPARVVTPSWFYGEWIGDRETWGLFVLDVIRTRDNLMQAESVVQQAALDKYSFIRDAWTQRRRSATYDGSPPRPKEED
jgi:phospholipid-binding lipoprotein MlaA